MGFLPDGVAIMSEQVHVIAYLYCKEGCVESLKVVLTDLIGPTRKETGCLRYDLVQNHFDPREMVFVEIWESRAALDVHLRSGYLQDIAFRLEGLLEKPVDIRLYGLIES